jgi:hypothetical protein
MRDSCRVMLWVLSGILALLPRGSSAETLDACGRVEVFSGCLYFEGVESPSLYLLPESTAVQVGGIYHFTAEIYRTAPVCGDFYNSWRLRNVVVEPCVPDTFRCGRIMHRVNDYDCVVWESLTDDRAYLLYDLQGHALGDTVGVVGIPCPGCYGVVGTCVDFGFILFREQLIPCPDVLNPIRETSWGQIKNLYR